LSSPVKPLKKEILKRPKQIGCGGYSRDPFLLKIFLCGAWVVLPTWLQAQPVATTSAANNITINGATLNGIVNPNGQSTDTWYQYSIDPTFPVLVTTYAGTGEAGWNDGAVGTAKFDGPAAMVMDQANNIYITDNHRIRKITPEGVVSTIAGTPSSWGLVDGPVETAQFFHPRGLAIDNSTGILYVADTGNDRIRKITPEGIVSTFAGSGSLNFSDGVGTAASFSSPSDLAIDSQRNLYVADILNHRIRKITSEGVVTTYAGTGNGGFVDGPAATARFYNPAGVAVDSSDNVYVADSDNNRIRKITPDGIVSTIADSGLSSPGRLAIDNLGNFYVSGGNRIHKVTPGGIVSILSGSGNPGFIDGMAQSARFDDPAGLLINDDGDLYVADFGNNRIRKIIFDQKIISQSGLDGTNPLPISAIVTGLTHNTLYYYRARAANGGGMSIGTTLNFTTLDIAPTNLTYFSNPVVYPRNTAIPNNVPSNSGGIATSYAVSPSLPNGLSLNPTTGVISGTPTTLTASASYTVTATNISGSTNCPVTIVISDPPSVTTVMANGITNTSATLHGTANPNGNPTDAWMQYSADSNVPLSSLVSTFAGSGSQGSSNGSATSASFNRPADVAIDNGGNLYVADRNNHRIRKITPEGATTTFAGSGSLGFADGNSATAQFNVPEGVAVNSAGIVYVADTSNHRIRKITAAGTVTTLAGSGEQGYADGIGTEAQFNNPRGVAVDEAGNVYVADSFNNRIRKITAEGVVTTFAGSGDQDFADGIGLSASFHTPGDLTLDAANNIYVADTWNNRIRKISLAGEVTTIAGSGEQGFADGQGTAASFYLPSDVAIDSAENLYVSDSNNYRVRKIVDGLVSTLAGSGISGFANGSGQTANFNDPAGLTLDRLGNVFIADFFNNRIRKIAVGLSTTVQTGLTGTNPIAFNGGAWALIPGATYYYRTVATNSGGTALGSILSFTTQNSAPSISNISDMAVNEETSSAPLAFTVGDAESSPNTLNVTFSSDNTNLVPNANLVLGGSGANRTLTVTPAPNANGTATLTVTVSDGFLTATDTFLFTVTPVNDTPTLAPISNPTPVYVNAGAQTLNLAGIGTGAADEAQTLVITATSDNPSLIPHPTVNYTSPAATGSLQYTSTPDQNGTAVITVTVDDGQATNNTVTRTFTVTILPFAPVVTTTAATNITATSTTLNGLVNPQNGSTNASFYYTTDSAFSTPVTVSTLAGSGTAGFADGIGEAASFSAPFGIAIDSMDNIYVADSNNHRIRKVSPTGLVSTFAGSGSSSPLVNGPSAEATFSTPLGVAVDNANNVYVSAFGNNLVRKITPDGMVSTYAVGMSNTFLAPYGIAIDPQNNVYVGNFGNGRILKVTPALSISTLASGFNGPRSLAAASDGTVYVGEHAANRVRKITPSGTVSTLAGSGTAAFADGIGTAASFWFPSGETVGPDGNIYVGDAVNCRIRKITPGGVVTTLAGSGIFGYANGLGTEAQFQTPRGVVFDSMGNLYVAETGGRIRKITPGLVAPAQTDLMGTAPVPVNTTLTDLQPDTTYYYRVSALNGGGPSIGTILSFTTLAIAPSNLTYSANPAVYVKNAAIVPNTPFNSGGNIISYSIFPTLPDGLLFDTTTGIISGIPLETASAADYTITATNSGGSTETTLSLAVFDSGLAIFRSQNDLASDGSQDLLTPASDGVSNLLKFAFNMIGIGAGQAPSLSFPNSSVLSASGDAGLPFSGVNENGRLTVAYIRRKAATNPGITYAVEFSSSNLNGSWAENGAATTEVADINATFERVTVTDSETGPRRFVRVRVTAN
jgi:sugar lactone lactonase YvrE